MIKLFYAPGTCAMAPHIVLEWIGKPYDLQKVKQSDPEYLKLNPLGQVPATIDGESGVMNQGNAIKAIPVFVNPRVNSQLQQIAQLIDDGHIKVTVEQTFDLSEAAKAQEVSQHGHPRGKLVLQVVG